MYDNKVCPFCKTTFSATDDIVVCSSCEMPHHKDCWVENGGCTTFGCMGTINAVSGQANSVTNTEMRIEEFEVVKRRFCGYCGATLNNVDAKFCGKCGKPTIKV